MSKDPTPALDELLAAVKEATESQIRAHLKPQDGFPESLAEATRYAALGGGKRIRPVVCMLSARALGGQPSFDHAARPAAALELVHAYSLVHDDLPAMDDDDFRRGRPSCHRAFSEGLAVLAGDALLTEAFNLLANAGFSDGLTLQMIRRLGAAAGMKGMVGGQADDLDPAASWSAVEDLQGMHDRKTGALFQCAAELGALTAEASTEQLERMGQFGGLLGRLFQLTDDLLDWEGQELTAPDEQRTSLVALLGIEAARSRAARWGEDAVQLLVPLGSTGQHLQELVQRIVHRDH